MKSKILNTANRTLYHLASLPASPTSFGVTLPLNLIHSSSIPQTIKLFPASGGLCMGCPCLAVSPSPRLGTNCSCLQGMPGSIHRKALNMLCFHLHPSLFLEDSFLHLSPTPLSLKCTHKHQFLKRYSLTPSLNQVPSVLLSKAPGAFPLHIFLSSQAQLDLYNHLAKPTHLIAVSSVSVSVFLPMLSLVQYLTRMDLKRY